ncbi:hypothetical protein F9288_11085 [Sphingomonas sp. CL5.1]|uniref:hypothetical protein n=1 Tax=Sphingomonas sp. CL5.1 TaxID=2653203 RepID=UPI001582A92A|nr:hypothetical protein [Sphingomonas sp. CL5.1]QKS00111.1 hypothetical protein F9288_11085 [Sphingomonas sp. CL5.1]
MGAPKPLASLSSGLLARKGQARPAMRPQGFASLAGLSSAGEDLGWNDMGEPAAAVPPVLVEREALHEVIATQPEPEPVVAEAPARAPVALMPLPPAIDVSVATAARIRRETAHRRKAAFTLRMDEERHLRLRLASATRNRSAQQLVTEALDAFIATLPEVETLVAQLPPRKRR